MKSAKNILSLVLGWLFRPEMALSFFGKALISLMQVCISRPFASSPASDLQNKSNVRKDASLMIRTDMQTNTV